MEKSKKINDYKKLSDELDTLIASGQNEIHEGYLLIKDNPELAQLKKQFEFVLNACNNLLEINDAIREIK